MAQPVLAYRIAANVEELRRNMAQGLNQIEAVKSGFTRLETAFRGDRLIAAAHNTAAAVESIGGASMLTEREQARVNATVQKALDKYAVLGKEAPQALKDLAAQTAQAEQKTSFLATAAGKLVAAFSVAALANVANKVLNLTGKLTDLQGKTGINTTELQVLNYTLGQSGVSIEQAASAAVKMGRALVGDDKAAVAAVQALGLNVKDLIAAGPEQAFLQIGSAIAGIPNPMEQAALAVAVFGKSGADLLPAFTVDMAAVGDEARRSGAIISADLVAAGDAAGDSLTRLQGTGLALIANVFLPMAPGIEAIANWLGGALTSSLGVARGAIDWLIASGMQMEVWLREMALSIAETVKSVPGLGRVFGETSQDIEGMRRSVQEAKDALAIFESSGAKPVVATVSAALPIVTDFGERMAASGRKTSDAERELAKAEAATRRFWEEVERLNDRTAHSMILTGQWTTKLQDVTSLMSRSTAETGKMQGALESWANQHGAVFAPTIKSSMESATAASGGFMSSIKSMFGVGGAEGGGTSLSSVLGAVGPNVAAALLGPGSATDKMKAFATQGMGALLSMVPGVGPWLSAFSGPIVEGLSKLASKAKDILGSFFGGPSGAEKKGREAVAAYEAQLASTLTATQKLEAGGEAWKETVIAIRDAYIAQGRTEEEALAAAKRLWESSKKGAGETEAAIAAIEAVIKGTGTAASAAADEITGALRSIPRDIDVNVNVRRNGETDYEETSSSASFSGGGRTSAAFVGVSAPSDGNAIARAVQAAMSDLKDTLPLAMRDAVMMAGAR